MQADNTEQKVAVVTGSSSGIGFATSLKLATNGFYTYASVHNLDRSRNINEIASKERLPLQVVQLDVNDDSSVKGAIEKIMSEKGRIDVLVNNAGYGLIGAFEDLSIEEIKSQFETNFFGVIRVTQQILPVMRRQKRGIIVNMSSVNGRIALPSISAYVSTKFAIEGVSESIVYELEPFGIKVVLIEPSIVKTNFKDKIILAKKALDPNSPYSQLMQKLSDRINLMMENAIEAEEVAKTILRVVTVENPQFRYTVGDDAATLMEIRKNMSDAEFQNIIKQNVIR
jgi:NAD(P)-dependent dehydrogenase (short-subunit alcohol dehydrogenase family)